MSKPIRIAATLVAGLLLSAPAWSPALSATPSPTLDAVKARGVLKVGTTGDYKPFTFRKPDGSFEGADIAMAESLAKAIGVKVEFVPTTWSAMSGDFVAGKFDVAMGGVSIIPARAEKGDFSSVVLTDGKRPVVRCADKAKFNSLAAIDQPGVRAIVNPGGTNESFARATYKQATLTLHPDNVTVFDQIAQNKADIMVTDGVEVDLLAATHPGVLCAAEVPQPFTRLEKAYWLPKDAGFKEFVDGWLAKAMASGEWKADLQAAMH